MQELEQRIEPQDRRYALAAQKTRERTVVTRAQRVAKPQHSGRELRGPPERGRRVQVGCDEVRKLGESVERERRFVLHMKERRFGAGAIERMPSHKDAVCDSILASKTEDRSCPAQV